jgi:hypothetical protein
MDQRSIWAWLNGNRNALKVCVRLFEGRGVGNRKRFIGLIPGNPTLAPGYSV